MSALSDIVEILLQKDESLIEAIEMIERLKFFFAYEYK